MLSSSSKKIKGNSEKRGHHGYLHSYVRFAFTQYLLKIVFEVILYC